VIDLLLLGMGEDGHIASLFPGSPALAETRRWIVPVPHDGPPPPSVWRVTVTFPLILAARQVVLIVSGAGKSDRLHQALFGQAVEPLLPVQKLHELEGQLVWLVDQAAAGMI
jgi:6-phosphogluconolactonase